MLEKINNPGDLKSLTIEEMKTLASEIRSFLIEKVSLSGGHLSSNLGIVEITMALHYVFDSPKDGIIWDVGHQSYVHKILTGRKDAFDKLRCEEGISGFPCPKESEHDIIHTGHSSTSLSIASGIAMAKKLANDTSKTIAVIGDGAFTNGMVYEAINHIAEKELPVLIILNDNGMSISRSVGGISLYLKELETTDSYLKIKSSIESLKNKIPILGKLIVTFLYKTKEVLKRAFMPTTFFEDLGISYFGPIDGHNLDKLITVLNEVKGLNKPMIIHIKTIKGKGHKPSEDNPGMYHGIEGSKIEGENGHNGNSYSKIFGDTLIKLAEKDDKIFAITAAMKAGTGLREFARRYPDRFTDVGIAEEHAVDYALGLSLMGYKPVVAIYSTFLQRAFDQLIHDVSIANAKMIFCMDRAGLVPGDGETHQGIFDISYISMIPNFKMMLPASKTELEMMLEYAANNLDSPVVIRYPKDDAIDYKEYNPRNFPIKEGEIVKIKDGRDITLLACGTVLKDAILASKEVKKVNIDVEILNLRFAKPINESVIKRFASDSKPLLILEEGIKRGGVSEYLISELNKIGGKKRVYNICIEDNIPSLRTSRDKLLDAYFLTWERIAYKIKNIIKL